MSELWQPEIAPPPWFQERLDYVAESAVKLGREVLKRPFVPDAVCLYTSPDKFCIAKEAVYAFGSMPPLYLSENELQMRIDPSRYVTAHTWLLGSLGVRRVANDDVTRQGYFGHAEFPVYDAVLDEMLDWAGSVQGVSADLDRQGGDRIELRHPDFDVLAYVVSIDSRPESEA